MASKRKSEGPAAPRGKLGVWIFGARGGLATTMIVGAKAIAKKLVGTQGLLTETAGLENIGLQKMSGLVFGGHEVRAGNLRQAAPLLFLLVQAGLGVFRAQDPGARVEKRR